MKKLILTILLVLIFSNCNYNKLIEETLEPEMIEFVEYDGVFITVYTNYRELDFDPSTYRQFNLLLDTMKYDTTNSYELIDND